MIFYFNFFAIISILFILFFKLYSFKMLVWNNPIKKYFVLKNKFCQLILFVKRNCAMNFFRNFFFSFFNCWIDEVRRISSIRTTNLLQDSLDYEEKLKLVQVYQIDKVQLKKKKKKYLFLFCKKKKNKPWKRWMCSIDS